MRNSFPEEKSTWYILFTVQAIIQCYSPIDITDKGIMGYQMDKEHAGRSAASLPWGVFLFLMHHEKGHYQEGFERRICDNVSASVSPKHRHRHNSATEETRRLEEMYEQRTRRDKQIPLAWSHEEPLLHCALCALLGCSTLTCQIPKPSQNFQTPSTYTETVQTQEPLSKISQGNSNPPFIFFLSHHKGGCIRVNLH